ncbi:MAG: hypothetical protein ACYTG6_12095, partial [Planctomycetota bacterium]
NLAPCTVNADNISLQMFQRGGAAMLPGAATGNLTGFDSIDDADPSPFSWGSTNSTDTWNLTDPATAQTIPATIDLVQDFESTKIVLTPSFGEYPDNALLVVTLSFGIQDFGGQPLTPTIFSFTTENRNAQTAAFPVEFNGDIPINGDESTADVNSARSPNVAQGWLLFAGDGNNGSNLLVPAGPLPCVGQANDPLGKTPFDPMSDVNLNTGGTRNTCANVTDGSTAVVFEFQSFRIRTGVTVRVTGVNPAIILVQGDVIIEGGATLRTRADGGNGAPNGSGLNGATNGTTSRLGGTGMAGGGHGGRTWRTTDNKQKGDDGWAGFGSADYDTPAEQGGIGTGEGGSATASGNTIGQGASQGGGGGGHATPGGDAGGSPGPGTTWFTGTFGEGGAAYGVESLATPSAGSGGGGAGDYDHTSSTTFEATGGSGGAGGGFVDLTCQGDIFVFGTIDAAGSRGGNGGNNATWAVAGGGGAGSGGGIRLLTPNAIDVSNGTLTTAGGQGGGASQPTPPNIGANGASGRIAMEDADSVIAGFTLATIVPTEGNPGFFRGPFNAGRFQGGGTEPQVVSDPFFLGPLAADFITPAPGDFDVTLPTVAVRPAPGTAMLLEVQGYPILANGEPDLLSGTGYYTVGHFRDSGAPTPNWFPNQNPSDVGPIPNSGIGIFNIDGSAYLQLRLTFYLPSNIGPFDPGPYMDRWTVRFTHDQ